MVEFLEYHKVTPIGLRVAIDHHWNGRTLESIVMDDEAHDMLRDDLGIGSKINRLALMTAVKENCMPVTVLGTATIVSGEGEITPQYQPRRHSWQGKRHSRYQSSQ